MDIRQRNAAEEDEPAMAWEMRAAGSTGAVRLPYAALRQQFSVRWSGPGNALVIAVIYRATVPDLTPGCEWPPVVAPLVPTVLQPNQEQFGDFLFPVRTLFLRAVEDWRQSRPLPLRVEARATVVWFLQQQGRSEVPEREDVYFNININRDQWHSLLTAIGWDEFETFEVPVRAPKGHETLRQGLGHLRSAQVAFRLGQWTTVVTDARKAIEAAASVTSDDPNRGKKIEALVNSVVQGDANQAKRDTLSGLMLALKTLRDEAAHGGNLGCQVFREDAELALTVAVSIFRYLGDSLARLEGLR